MAYRAALVDFDGTLVDSMPFWLELPRRTLAEAGIPEPEGFEETIRRFPMHEIAVLLSEQLPALPGAAALTERWMARMADNYRRRVRPKPGAAALLELFRSRGMKVALLTATRRDLLEVGLAASGLAGLLDAVFTEETVGSKRTPEPYRRCAQALGMAAEELLLVEDAPRNLAAAAGLGLGTLGVYDASMAAWREEMERTADVYLTDYHDLSRVGDWLTRTETGERT